MSLDIFLNFDGDCRAALVFYAEVFKTGEPAELMTYGQNPGGCDDEDRDRILYASLPIFGHNFMFSDCPSGNDYTKGSNIALTLGCEDSDELCRIFAALSEDGQVYMPLDKTFFSELYGMVQDKFGITWQISLTAFESTAAFSALAKARYSVRSYKPQPVEAEKLAEILEAGRVAPTACNNQPQRIKIIDTPDSLAKMDECTPFRFGASTVLLICYDRTQVWKRSFDGAASGDVDAGIVTTHLMLAAQEQGLGSCWVMYFDPEKTREAFGLPENIVPVAYLPIGYAAEDCKPADRHFQRKLIDEILI